MDLQIKGDVILNLPNKLTLFRIILIPFYIFFATTSSVQNTYFFAFIIFLLASFTDFLDGYIARNNNIITDFGKLMDPLADKMLVISALIIFASQGVVSSIAVIIIILRDFIVNSIRLLAASEGKVIAADIYGKIKTVVQMVAIVMILIYQMLEDKVGILILNNVKICADVLVWLAVILTVISAINYLAKNKKFFKIK